MKLKFYLKLKNFTILSVLNDNEIIVSKQNKVLIYNISKQNFRIITVLPAPIFYKFFNYFSIFTRILRLGVRYSLLISKHKLVLVFNKKIFEINLIDGAFNVVFNIIRGSRPLNISKVDDIKTFNSGLYFGEYFSNLNKKPVNIYRQLSGDKWEIAFTFSKNKIDHIHAIIPDKFQNCLWILTGDFNNGAGIWKASNNFKEVKPILIGKQIYRSCVAFPTEKGLIYATDSQFITNSIRLLCNENGRWVSKFLSEVNGPVIYGCKVKNNMYFSTSVEGDSNSKGRILKYFDTKLGPGIKENFSHIIGGNYEDGFKSLLKLEKDKYPFILFQFGAITFPTGINKNQLLYTNNISLKNINLDSIIYKIID